MGVVGEISVSLSTANVQIAPDATSARAARLQFGLYRVLLFGIAGSSPEDCRSGRGARKRAQRPHDKIVANASVRLTPGEQPMIPNMRMSRPTVELEVLTANTCASMAERRCRCTMRLPAAPADAPPAPRSTRRAAGTYRASASRPARHVVQGRARLLGLEAGLATEIISLMRLSWFTPEAPGS